MVFYNFSIFTAVEELVDSLGKDQGSLPPHHEEVGRVGAGRGRVTQAGLAPDDAGNTGTENLRAGLAHA